MLIDAHEAAQTIQKYSAGMDSGKFTKWVTLSIAITALLSAFAGVMSGRCTTRGLVAKNDAVLKQDEATNKWSFFQSRNLRLEIAETQDLLLSLSRQLKPSHTLNQKAHNENFEISVASSIERRERFRKERDQTYSEAKQLESERDQLSSAAGKYLDVSRDFTIALTLLQVALLLIPVSLVTRKRSNLYLGVLMTGSGFLFLILAYKNYFSIIS